MNVHILYDHVLLIIYLHIPTKSVHNYHYKRYNISHELMRTYTIFKVIAVLLKTQKIYVKHVELMSVLLMVYTYLVITL